jgi:hypothetical protein
LELRKPFAPVELINILLPQIIRSAQYMKALFIRAIPACRLWISVEVNFCSSPGLLAE